MANYKYNEEEDVLITIQDILYILKSNILAIIIFAIVGGVIFGAYSKFVLKPTYKAEARMYVLSSSGSELLKLSELEMSTQLASDYIEMMLSRPMLEEVIDTLSLNNTFTTRSLSSVISIENPADTRILNISVKCGDAALAADIANTLADVSAKNISEIMEIEAPKVFQRAVVDTKKVAPSNARNTMMGMILGVVAALGIAMFLYITDDTMKTEEDIERYTNLANFGMINDDSSRNEKRKKKSKKGYYAYGYGAYKNRK